MGENTVFLAILTKPYFAQCEICTSKVSKVIGAMLLPYQCVLFQKPFVKIKKKTQQKKIYCDVYNYCPCFKLYCDSNLRLYHQAYVGSSGI